MLLALKRESYRSPHPADALQRKGLQGLVLLSFVSCRLFYEMNQGFDRGVVNPPENLLLLACHYMFPNIHSLEIALGLRVQLAKCILH